ncbi:tRNA (cytidine(34)-2'-O)-methyltransferase [Aciduricibacillus chroicocephali]|uniref:Putative tRNA (cytidine(34)-2'-O)-methyltransferase n=1 Tax=Aciduricibacillus chroicocephali TaxID=3054939 RepID=A0ABY9KXW1_9BACI|nr:tRNA (cytidine(34)-2'-O)-methyltransferase [Bacillaceae bacterium 44XB]
MGLHVALYQPEIPPNTGNIARTCLGTGTSLHLIHPLGFKIDDKTLRRAGLDYWKHVDVHEHESFEALHSSWPNAEFYYIENYGTSYLTDVDFNRPDRDIFLVLGKETTGIPHELLVGKEDRCLRIHMNDQIRSLNLSNACAIAIYEVLRQQGFPNLK